MSSNSLSSETADRGHLNRPKAALAVVLVALFGAYIANIGTGFPHAMGLVQPNGDLPDAVFDWLSVRAIVAEGSPSDPAGELASIHLGLDLEAIPHPRAPAALLLQLPLAFMPVSWVWPGMTVLVITTGAIAMWISTRLGRWAWPWILAFGIPLMITEPMMASMLLGSQAPLVGAMVAGAWLIVRHRDSKWAGVLVGLAAALKLFPGLLIPILWVSKRRLASYTSVAVFVGLNLAGLLLPDVTISGALATLSPSVESWSHNLAPGLPPLAVAILGALVVWLARRVSIDTAMALGIGGMLALSPVVWNHYLVILVAPTIWLLGRAIFGVAEQFSSGATQGRSSFPFLRSLMDDEPRGRNR